MSIKKQFYDEGFIIIRNLINEELIRNILESLKKFKQIMFTTTPNQATLG